MKKVVFDTNVVINAAIETGDSKFDQELIDAVINEELIGIVTANTITDIHFILKKRVGEEKARQTIYNILSIFDISPIDGEICLEALNMQIKDYEDACLAVCANKKAADYIATNDETFIRDNHSLIPTLRPKDILSIVHGKFGDN